MLLFFTLLLCFASGLSAVAPLIGKIEDQLPHQYIVIYKDEHHINLISQDISSLPHKHKIEQMYQHTLKGYSATLTKEELETVRANPLVKHVERDQLVELDASNCTRSVPVPGVWGLSRVSERRINPKYLNYTYPASAGQGVTIYVVDTGIYVEHSEFQGRATNGWKASSSWSSGDRDGHGTHVASTAIGLKYGAAKKARVIGVKVFDGSGGTLSGILGGIDWVAGQAKSKPGQKIVVNLSLRTDSSSTVDDAVNRAAMYGALPIASAGNADRDACGQSPASASTGGRTITVGSSNQELGYKNIDSRSDFSNFGKCVSLFAPGHDILGASHQYGPSGTAIMSGTSMASPLVAGIAALYMSEYPNLSALEIRKLILSNATPIPDMSSSCDPWDPPNCDQSPKLMAFNGCASGI